MKWVGGNITTIVGCMEARNAKPACTACRGRGWKFSRSRRTWVVGAMTRGQTGCARRTCMECKGSGQLTASAGEESWDTRIRYRPARHPKRSPSSVIIRASPAPPVRADLAMITAGFPAAEDLILLTSELATNAILHSRSGHPRRTFTVGVTLPRRIRMGRSRRPGRHLGGGKHDEEHGRGLAIVAAVAGDGNWGIEGDEASRVAWFRIDWNQK